MNFDRLYNYLADVVGESCAESILKCVNHCLLTKQDFFTERDKLQLLYHLMHTSYDFFDDFDASCHFSIDVKL